MFNIDTTGLAISTTGIPFTVDGLFTANHDIECLGNFFGHHDVIAGGNLNVSGQSLLDNGNISSSGTGSLNFFTSGNQASINIYNIDPTTVYPVINAEDYMFSSVFDIYSDGSASFGSNISWNAGGTFICEGGLQAGNTSGVGGDLYIQGTTYFGADNLSWVDGGSGNAHFGADMAVTGNLGFFGVTPIGQQTSSGATTAPAVYNATAQTMLQQVYNAMRAYGLLS
jgi:hypothetical protein